MLRFRLFNIPFQIDASFWFGSALIGGNLATGDNAVSLLLVWVACVFVSIVVHELGHALSARRFGTEPVVELYTLGGLTRMFGRPLSRRENFWVTLCGPAAGFALFLLVFAADRWYETSGTAMRLSVSQPDTALLVDAASRFLKFINLVWTCFNLLPILPLDGGRLLASALGPQRQTATQGVGLFFAGSMAVVALFYGQWFVALYLGYLALVNFRGDPRALPGGPGR